MAIHRGNAYFVDEKPFDDKHPDIYAYHEFPSLERMSYGLARIEGGPKGKIIDQEEVGEDRFDEPITKLADAHLAIEEADSKYTWEEAPAAEFEEESDYRAFIEAAGNRLKRGKKHVDWWDGPGVYDGRDGTKMYDSVEEYELATMQEWITQGGSSWDDDEAVAAALAKLEGGEDRSGNPHEQRREKRFASIEADDDPSEPEEDDITTEDHERWYQSGKLYFTGDERGLVKKMDADRFWPNVWFISDHGNAHLVNLSESARRK